MWFVFLWFTTGLCLFWYLTYRRYEEDTWFVVGATFSALLVIVVALMEAMAGTVAGHH